MTIAGRFLRVSGSGQSEAGQEPDVDRYIADKGYEPGPTYRLHGKSATKGEQDEAFAEVLDDVRTGRIDVLICWAIDRLDRRGIGSAFGMKAAIEEAGGTIEFVQEPSQDELIFAVKSWVAEREAKHKAERSRTGLDETRANGAATTRPPWGLVSVGPKRRKAWTPTEAGSRWIPVIFSRIAKGASLRVLGEELRAADYDGPASAPGLSAMVRNPAYKGLQYDRSGAIGHRCEALVSPTVWQRANDALADRTRTRRGPRLARAMLAGALHCETCGTTMYRDKAARGRERSYYLCNTCHYSVPLARVEDIVDRAVGGGHHIVWTREWIPGTDHADELLAVTDELARLGLRGLSEDDEDAERTRLRAERRRLENLPKVLGFWDETIDHEHPDYAGWWAEVPEGQRGAWLKSEGYVITASPKSVTVEFPWDETATTALA